MSQSCAAANSVKDGEVRVVDAETGINEIINKLNVQERNILAEYIMDTI